MAGDVLYPGELRCPPPWETRQQTGVIAEPPKIALNRDINYCRNMTVYTAQHGVPKKALRE